MPKSGHAGASTGNRVIRRATCPGSLPSAISGAIRKPVSGGIASCGWQSSMRRSSVVPDRGTPTITGNRGIRDSGIGRGSVRLSSGRGARKQIGVFNHQACRRARCNKRPAKRHLLMFAPVAPMAKRPSPISRQAASHSLAAMISLARNTLTAAGIRPSRAATERA